MKPTHIGLEEGRRTLPELTARAHAGHCSVLTRHGRPYAAIVPLDLLRQAPPRASMLSLRGTGKGLWPKGASALVSELRDEWA